MMKIGLATFFDSNYGSSLQCFATKTFLESLNVKCDVLYKFVTNSKWNQIKQRFKNYTQMLFHPSFFRYKLECRRRKRDLWCKNPTEQTRMLINSFVNERIQPKIVSNSELKNKKWQQQYDYFITGSDQVWNIDTIDNDFFFLTFAYKKKRIALATSFGISVVPSYNEKKFKLLINGFDYISVREETGVDIVQKYSSARVVRIADPTLVYSDDEWRGFIKERESIATKYILIHFLNNPNNTALESISWLSEQQNLDIIAIGYNYDRFKTLKRLTFMDGNPLKYVSLIDCAEYILTDSFHSTLFSINFSKKFYTFHRQYLFRPQTSRISDLLKRYNLNYRLIDDIRIIKNSFKEEIPIKVKEKLNHERLIIRDYIKKAISGQIPQCFLEGENNAT